MLAVEGKRRGEEGEVEGRERKEWREWKEGGDE